jgi:uncharacterized Ntn-hydrolase superfamily protein
MTFSIAARMGDAYGVAVASKFIAVGSVVPGVRIGVGAVATQAMAKVSYREDVLDLLAGGVDAETAVARVTGADEGRAHRQLGVVAATSQATFTGGECNAWAGGRAGGDESGRYAIQGNILTGEDVVLEMERAWLGGSGMPLPRRLLAALLAGDAAGGDSRGRQGAAMVVLQPDAGYDGSGVLVDLRVDDHPAAPTELARLLDLFDLYFGEPQDVQPLTGELAQEVSARLASLGHTDADVHAALEAWSGVENYEMLLTPAGIDGRVLEALRAATPGTT